MFDIIRNLFNYMKREFEFGSAEIKKEDLDEGSAIEKRESSIEKEPFDEKEALAIEESGLGGFDLKSKAGKIVKVLTLVSALAFPVSKFDEAVASESKNSSNFQRIEMTSDHKKSTEDFINVIKNLPDNPRAVSPAQNELMKKRAAKIF